MLHIMKLKRAPFDKIRNGSKTIELRLNDEKRQKVNIGDFIEFCCKLINADRLGPFFCVSTPEFKKDIDNQPNVWYYYETPEKMNTIERKEK